MILPDPANLMLALMFSVKAISALAIAPDVRTPCPQIYSKQLHSARIYEALTTKKNLRTVTRTVDASVAIATRLANAHPALAHEARDYEDFITTKPWQTMTIEQEEVVYVTTTRKAATAAVESGNVEFASRVPSGTAAVETKTEATGAKKDAETTKSVNWEARWSKIFVPTPSAAAATSSSAADGTKTKKEAEETESTPSVELQARVSERFPSMFSAIATSSPSSAAAAATTFSAAATTSKP